ncbi:hypothetical protein [Parablautia sp. Marseille-Q6255]|uniref:hypothetical protein n=1 Tax=Parablautia sp. Marseille-Q6255 TaxID=3039593 RepID=UPI0024BD235D|nr:hypothetical protein [Parablautia sp. Marseille-Q6255]
MTKWTLADIFVSRRFYRAKPATEQERSGCEVRSTAKESAKTEDDKMDACGHFCQSKIL